MTSLRDTHGHLVRLYDTAGHLMLGDEGDSALTVRRGIAVDLWRTGRVTATNRTAAATYLSPHRVRAEAKDLQLTWGGNLPVGVTMPLAASITVDGDRRRVTWGGQASILLDGETPATSDPIDLHVHPGQTIEAMTFYGARSDGLAHPGAPGAWYSSEILPGDQTMTGQPGRDPAQGYDGSRGYRPIMPHAITGLTRDDVRSWALLGDSITESGAPPLEAVGTAAAASRTWAHRTLDGAFPVVNTAIWGSSHASAGRVGTWATIPDLTTCTDALLAWGFNDLDQAWSAPSRDATYVQARALETWAWVGAEVPRLWQATISPATTSTDGWATIEGQTPRESWPYRRIFNAWLRDGAPLAGGAPAEPGATGAVRAGEAGHPLAGVIDQAARVESEPGSGIFRVDHGPLTTDGGHPNLVGHDLMGAALADALGL